MSLQSGNPRRPANIKKNTLYLKTTVVIQMHRFISQPYDICGDIL